MTRQHPIRDAGLALSLLTAIPTPARWPDDGRTHVAGWFPVVGGILGLAGYALAKLAEMTGVVHRAPYLVAVLVVLMWALMTRFLHWDGLADVADGYWGSNDPARRLEIMSDSHIGAFGATAVVMVAIVEVAAIGSFLPDHQFLVLIAAVFARFSATAAAWLGTPARPGGLGRSVMGRPSATELLVCGAVMGLACVALALGYELRGTVLAGFGLIVALGAPHVLARRFGGVTGDVMGASVLITEAALFAAFAFVL